MCWRSVGFTHVMEVHAFDFVVFVVYLQPCEDSGEGPAQLLARKAVQSTGVVRARPSRNRPHREHALRLGRRSSSRATTITCLCGHQKRIHLLSVPGTNI